jgi:hypothetical protein
LYYGDINGTITNRIVLGNTTSTTFTDMYAGVTYFFYVTAYNQSAQESEPSNTITYSTDPGVNSAPVLAAIPNQTVNEGTKLTLTASATDSDTPANLLTYSLDPGAPAGMTINSSTGVLTWTPTESQGPNVSTITVRVTDNGVPPLSDTKSFSVRVNEVNSAPVLAVIANQTVNKGSTLTLTATATDSDLPANTLTYSLDSGADAGTRAEHKHDHGACHRQWLTAHDRHENIYRGSQWIELSARAERDCEPDHF